MPSYHEYVNAARRLASSRDRGLAAPVQRWLEPDTRLPAAYKPPGAFVDVSVWVADSDVLPEDKES